MHDRPESLGHPSKWGRRHKTSKGTYLWKRGLSSPKLSSSLCQTSATLARDSQVKGKLDSLGSLCFQWSTSEWDSFCDIVFCTTCRESQRWLTSKLADKLAVHNKVVVNIPQRITAGSPVLIITISTVNDIHVSYVSHLTWHDIIGDHHVFVKYIIIFKDCGKTFTMKYTIYIVFSSKTCKMMPDHCFLMRK